MDFEGQGDKSVKYFSPIATSTAISACKADFVFETKVYKEIPGISHEFTRFVLVVIAFDGEVEISERQPILFMKEYEFATIVEGWRFRR